jgi:chromosome segregation ATPase
MSRDSDLYGEDIRLWSETQGALLRRLAAGEAVTDQVDWPHVIEEVEDLGRDAQHLDRQQEIVRLTGLLAATEARAKELRARLDDLTGKLSDAYAELAAVQDQADVASARTVAAVEAEQAVRQAAAEAVAELRRELGAPQMAQDEVAALRQAEAARKAGGRLARAWRAWRGE